MIKRFYWLFYCLLFLIPGKAFANHVYGGELYYTHITGLTYRVTLTLYGDCGSANQPGLASLDTASPVINILLNQAVIDTLHLKKVITSGREITPVCKDKEDSTQCTSLTYPFPGIRKFVYSQIYSLPSAANDWAFVFDGNTGTPSAAGRSSNITNIFNAGNQTLYLQAELDNSNGPNSSPIFTTIPTPFYCINLLQQYNQGAIDDDNDSLIYSLAPAINNGQPVTYNPPYSDVYPMSTTNGVFNINSLNGQLSFTPNMVQNSLIVNKVIEYRNGVQVGSSIREMTFIVLNNCQNAPPEGFIDTSNINGGIVIPGNIVNVCEGTSLVSFIYPVNDPNGDTVDVSFSMLPAGASLIINNNHTPLPSLNFSWNTATIAPGIYNFFVTIKDNHCPLNSQETRGFTIRIARPNSINALITKPTQCAHKATVQYDLDYGILPRTITIKQGNILIKTITDTTGLISDSLYAGSYDITVTSPDFFCATTYSLNIVDSGVYPYDPIVENPVLCIGNEPLPLNAIPHAGAAVHWYDIQGNLLSAPPIPNTDVAGTYYWLINQQRLVCSSKIDTVRVVVAPKPDATVLNTKDSVCYGDKIYLQATGASSYEWLPQEKIFYEPDGSIFIHVYEPTTYTLIASSGVGCKDTVNFSFNTIERCCNFTYPAAFTPNKDGLNETWRPLIYGNQDSYELSIYNRWGARLFHSFIPNAGWDGTYNGRLQDIGTYFYYLKAKCSTGREEQHKGDFILLR